MRPFNWGIVGTGNIAASMSAALSNVPGAVRSSVASRTKENAEAFAKLHGFDRAHGSYAALFADPDVEIVYIATPNACHKENILDALAAGKHVLCEKPMTLSHADSAQCFAAAEDAGLFLMEALWTAFFPATRKAVELVETGRIGVPRMIKADFVSLRDPATHPILFDPDLGGGAINDLGIYPVAVALLFGGPIVSSKTLSAMGDTGVDEMTVISLEHENGAVSTLSCGFRLDLPVAVSVIGDKGRVEILDDFHHPQRVQLILDDVTEIFECPSIGQGYAHEAIEAQERILGGSRQSAIWSADRTLACAKILQATPSQ